MRQLDVQHCGLNGIDAEIAADHRMVIARLHAVIAQGAHLRGERIVVADHHASIAKGAEVFGGVKGKPSRLAQRSRHA
jgi:hypothetical protein